MRNIHLHALAHNQQFFDVAPFMQKLIIWYTSLPASIVRANPRFTMQMFSNETISNKIRELPRGQKRTIAVLADILLCIFTVALSYRLRLDAWIYPIGNQWLSYVVAVGLSLPIFIRFGIAFVRVNVPLNYLLCSGILPIAGSGFNSPVCGGT